MALYGFVLLKSPRLQYGDALDVCLILDQRGTRIDRREQLTDF